MYKLDFLPVGNESRGGDAIALRFGSLLTPQQQKVVVLDGGTQESGASLVSHIKESEPAVIHQAGPFFYTMLTKCNVKKRVRANFIRRAPAPDGRRLSDVRGAADRQPSSTRHRLRHKQTEIPKGQNPAETSCPC
jgi:hypothetical protein